ncbi:MAG TPA: hypothetical protein VM639_09925 [Dongiaceae bacterium]|nr:hypothetical protein [Dongiaceae bacterium]
MSAGKLLTPTELKAVTEQAEMAKAKELLERMSRQESTQKDLKEAFMDRDVHPQVMERVNAAIRHAAEQGLHEIQVLSFPASYCNDKGRRINNLEADWPDSLEGFAKRAHEFFLKELQPLGYKARAQVLDYPHGMPGEVGLFLSW